MRKMKKLLSLILSVVCACCLFASCGGGTNSDNSDKPDSPNNTNVELAFKDNMISSVVVNTEVDLAPYVTYTEGYSAKLAATYEKDGETKSYDTYGLTFTATEVADVTVTISYRSCSCYFGKERCSCLCK